MSEPKRQIVRTPLGQRAHLWGWRLFCARCGETYDRAVLREVTAPDDGHRTLNDSFQEANDELIRV